MKGSGNNFSSPEQDIGTVSERSGSERCEYVQLGEGELKAGTCGSVQHDAQNIYHSNRKDVLRAFIMYLYTESDCFA